MVDMLAARQAAVMADGDRLQLLALLLTDPDGEASVARLTGVAAGRAQVTRHLEAMARVGLLDRVDRDGITTYRPTHDALVRFGSVALGGAGTATSQERAVHARMLARVSALLSEAFAGTFAPETVARYVSESYDLLASRARVRQHLPALTSRFASDRLTALARAQGPSDRTGFDVLFVCVHNSGRSQIAASVLRSLAGPGIRVRTAGSAPSDRIDPAVASALAARGWDRVAEFPKPLTDEVVRASDYVITMGCGDACPVVPGRRYVDWPVPDPAGQADAAIQAIIDDVEQRVRRLLGEVSAP